MQTGHNQSSSVFCCFFSLFSPSNKCTECCVRNQASSILSSTDGGSTMPAFLHQSWFLCFWISTGRVTLHFNTITQSIIDLHHMSCNINYRHLCPPPSRSPGPIVLLNSQQGANRDSFVAYYPPAPPAIQLRDPSDALAVSNECVSSSLAPSHISVVSCHALGVGPDSLDHCYCPKFHSRQPSIGQ